MTDGMTRYAGPSTPHARAEAPAIARILYFCGAGLTLVFLVVFSWIVQAIFDASPTTPRSAGVAVGFVTVIQHVLTSSLMIAGVLLFRTAPMGRRLSAAGIVVFFPVLSVGLNTAQGFISSALDLSPGPAFAVLMVFTSGSIMFAHAACLLMAWNLVAGRPVSVHLISVCGAAVLALVRALMQAAAWGLPGTSMSPTGLHWASFVLMLGGMTALFIVSWKRRHATR